MNKWKKAVLHLECATDSEHVYDRIKRIDCLRKDLDEGRITHEQFGEEITGRSRDIRYHGTAVFLTNNKKRYLVTARHMLWDKDSSNREFQEELERTQEWPEHMRPILLESAKDRALHTIFNIIFRVPSLDEILHGNPKIPPTFLMNLGAGGAITYTFSRPGLDLAIVSLDQRDSRFAEELVSKGYEPISVNDFAEEPTQEGVEVYTVGFPSATALLGQVSQHPAETHWSSSYYSLPTFSFGRVSMLHKALPFYWVDMSIYPGNSGGPVVEGDKLIGIVSGQPTIPVEKAEELQTRIPFGKIIKAKFIIELLSIQEEKDSHRMGHRST
jgi:hypothetical protein